MIAKLLSKSIVSALAGLTFCVASTLPAAAVETFPSEPLTIQTSDGKVHSFTAELATTDSQRQQGLMFRKTMMPTSGMLFDFGKDRDITMWMRNTLIPLDMLFISKEGVVQHINPNAVPRSEAIISSNGPVRYVLELNGGAAKNLGIRRGDIVRSKQVGNAN